MPTIADVYDVLAAFEGGKANSSTPNFFTMIFTLCRPWQVLQFLVVPYALYLVL
jgi:hypothetical protein